MPVGTEVFRVTATDRDDAANGDVTYSIIGGVRNFVSIFNLLKLLFAH